MVLMQRKRRITAYIKKADNGAFAFVKTQSVEG